MLTVALAQICTVSLPEPPLQNAGGDLSGISLYTTCILFYSQGTGVTTCVSAWASEGLGFPCGCWESSVYVHSG